MTLKDIGQRIRFFRLNVKNMSQEDFAKFLDYDRTFISRIESGRQNITIETLIKICDSLHISLKDFFDFDKIDFKERLL